MDRTLLDQAIEALQVRAVLLRSSVVRADDALLPPADGNLSLVVRHRAGPAKRFEVVNVGDGDGKAADIVIFRFRAGVRLIDQPAARNHHDAADASKDAARLDIAAEFGAHYRLRPDSDIESLRPALEEFGRRNVGLHVWPYWREYVQSTCSRMGVPAIPVRMYRLPAKPST